MAAIRFNESRTTKPGEQGGAMTNRMSWQGVGQWPARPLIGLVLALAACSTPAAPRPTATPFSGTPRPVIVDTDMAPDDWMAILYLLQRQDISVQAITVAGTGEAHCGPGVRNALGLAALAGQPNIPVACGRETPLQGSHAFPDDWRAGADAVLGLR